MKKLFQSICDSLDRGESVVVATVVGHEGHTPRSTGSKMVVRKDGSIVGSIGGGPLEGEAMASAVGLFDTGGTALHEFNLSHTDLAGMGMICGGRMTVFLERIESSPPNLDLFRQFLKEVTQKEMPTLVTRWRGSPERGEVMDRGLIRTDGILYGARAVSERTLDQIKEKLSKARRPFQIEEEDVRILVEPGYKSGTVFLFGAGHVSEATARLASVVDFRTVVLDDRPEFANSERFPLADEVLLVSGFDRCLEGLDIDRDSYLVIVTRGHLHDRVVLEQALGTEAGYIGMIGSRRKRDAIYKALLEQGMTESDLQRVSSPIGLAIAAETPEEIAVSIVGELIQCRGERLS